VAVAREVAYQRAEREGEEDHRREPVGHGVAVGSLARGRAAVEVADRVHSASRVSG